MDKTLDRIDPNRELQYATKWHQALENSHNAISQIVKIQPSSELGGLHPLMALHMYQQAAIYGAPDHYTMVSMASALEPVYRKIHAKRNTEVIELDRASGPARYFFLYDILKVSLHKNYVIKYDEGDFYDLMLHTDHLFKTQMVKNWDKIEQECANYRSSKSFYTENLFQGNQCVKDKYCGLDSSLIRTVILGEIVAKNFQNLVISMFNHPAYLKKLDSKFT